MLLGAPNVKIFKKVSTDYNRRSSIYIINCSFTRYKTHEALYNSQCIYERVVRVQLDYNLSKY